jgi:hypothetical protein
VLTKRDLLRSAAAIAAGAAIARPSLLMAQSYPERNNYPDYVMRDAVEAASTRREQ